MGAKIEDQILARIVEIAFLAGNEILKTFHSGSGLKVVLKSDHSPVTVADQAAHQMIAEALKQLTPDVPIISEEGEIPDYEIRKAWQQFWLVDPLDGTKGFIKGSKNYTVNIALIERGRPVLGVIGVPAKEVVYFGSEGKGSWKQEKGQNPIQIFSKQPERDQPLRVVESSSHPAPEIEVYLKKFKIEKRTKVSSSLKFCLVAEGAADLYPRFGPTMEWDVAAGDCIFRNSGRNFERKSPLVYNKMSLKNDSFVIGLD